MTVGKFRAGSPITFDIVDSDIDAVRLKIRVNSLFENPTKGKMKQTRVQLKVDIRPNLGAYTEVGTVNIYGRTTSNYDRQKRIELPAGGHPYSVRIRRITANSSDPNFAIKIHIFRLIRSSRIGGCATRIRLALASRLTQSGSVKRFPSGFMKSARASDYPSNYNPNTRVYSGV